MNIFNPLNTRWLPAAAFAVCVAGFLAVLRPALGGAMLLVASLGSLPLMFWGLALVSSEQVLTAPEVLRRPANLITLARLGLAVLAGLLGGLSALSTGFFSNQNEFMRTLISGYSAKIIAIIVCLSFIMDGLDGQAARLEARRLTKSGKNLIDLASWRVVGAWLDMETDSLLFFLYALLLVVLTPVPSVFLSVGLFRYVFGLLFLLPPWKLKERPVFSWTAKTIAAVSELCLCGLFLMESGLALESGQALESSQSAVYWIICVYLPIILLSFSFVTESVLRLRELSALGSIRHLCGLLHSFIVYHCIPGRQAKLRRLFAAFLKPGDLAIDVGAHLGNRVRAWRAMGVRVIAVEPQSSCSAALANWFSSDTGVTLVSGALGTAPGKLELLVSQANPTLASVSNSWVDQMSRHKDFAGIHWDSSYEVPVFTLDQLIARYGRPSFVKIDVEGYEAPVLAGLGQAVPALSFEFLPQNLQAAYECLERLEALARYEYNLSMVETQRFVFQSWVNKAQIREFISSYKTCGRSGDVYARLIRV